MLACMHILVLWFTAYTWLTAHTMKRKYPKHHHEYKETNMNYIPTASLRFPIEVQIKKLKIKSLYNRIIWMATIPETFVSVFQNSLKMVKQYFILNYIHFTTTQRFSIVSNIALLQHHIEHGCVKNDSWIND